MYRSLETASHDERIKFLEEHMPNVPDLTSMVDDVGIIDIIAARYGLLKLCCRRMLLGSYRKEDVISGTGKKYIESKK